MIKLKDIRAFRKVCIETYNKLAPHIRLKPVDIQQCPKLLKDMTIRQMQEFHTGIAQYKHATKYTPIKKSFLSIFSKSGVEELPSAIRTQFAELHPDMHIFKCERLADGRIKVWAKNGKSVTRSIFDASDAHRLIKSTEIGTVTTNIYHTKDNVWLKKGYWLEYRPRQTHVFNSVPGQKVLPKDESMMKRYFNVGENNKPYWGACEPPGPYGGWGFFKPLSVSEANRLARTGNGVTRIEKSNVGAFSLENGGTSVGWF